MKNILIPTDLTDCTKNTINYAISFAAKYKAKLFFYHTSEKQRIDNREYIIDFIKKSFLDLKVDFNDFQTEFITEIGDFSNQKLIKLSEVHAIDLIIMGASNEGIKTTFFGSHVSDLINDLNCPVISIPHGYSQFNINNIGYASELFDLKYRIKEIIPFAKLLNATIDIFHVYPVFPQYMDIKTFDIEKELARIKNDNNYDKINLHLIKTSFDNETVTGIKEFIKSYNPDLLVVCHKPRGLFDKFVFNTGTTISVVKSSQIPVLALNQKSACKIM